MTYILYVNLKNPGVHAELRAPIYQNQSSISETKPVTPNFYFISETGETLSVRSKSLKNIYRVENFRANVLKVAR